jgi:alpha-ketoglutarate-dependent 2,4-dichlorophenoxyacetate dioxygenase
MTVSIRPLRDNFSGEVSGIDISNTLSPNEVEAIEAGMDKYGVLIFHDQNVTDEQQMTFSANFGPPLEGSNTTVKRAALRLDPAFADVSNLDNDGGGSRRWVIGCGIQMRRSGPSQAAIPYCPAGLCRR